MLVLQTLCVWMRPMILFCEMEKLFIGTAEYIDFLLLEPAKVRGTSAFLNASRWNKV